LIRNKFAATDFLIWCYFGVLALWWQKTLSQINFL
jgi:hypothetical protein